MKKLTPWFEGSVKPVRKGVYERRGCNCPLPYPFYFFDGKKWKGGNGKSPCGVSHWPSVNAIDQKTWQWRGLANKPKGMK